MKIQYWVDSLCAKELEIYRGFKVKYLKQCVILLRKQEDMLERENRSLCTLLFKLRRLSNIKRIGENNERRKNNSEPIPRRSIPERRHHGARP